QGQVQKAIDCCEQALAIARQIGDKHGEGSRLCNLGSVFSRLGRLEEAMGCYEQALALARQIGDKCGEGSTVVNLGLAYARLARLEEAVALLEQALQTGQEIKDPQIFQLASQTLAELRGTKPADST